MIIEDRIKAFEKLGDFLMDFCDENSNSNHPLETIIQSSSSYNGWFTSNNIKSSIDGEIGSWVAGANDCSGASTLAFDANCNDCPTRCHCWFAK